MPSLFRRTAASRAMTCPAALAGALAILGVAGCAEPQRQGQPAFYRDLGSASAQVDTEQARAMISAYRLNAGLGPLVLDPALVEVARREATAMAGSDKPAQADVSRRGWLGKDNREPRPTSRPAIAASPRLFRAGGIRRSTTGS